MVSTWAAAGGSIISARVRRGSSARTCSLRRSPFAVRRSPFAVPEHVHQVREELDQVGPGALVPAGQIPQPAAVPDGRARGEVLEDRFGRGNPDLLGDVLDRVGRRIQAHPGNRPRQVQDLT
ncbi:hypothetical protein SSP531S_07110 [Streptomyces spongiicola]|uniref:Uncharacterized protein n=1 Tax=Streptomyces spongiicola TaxID=1690221 RepID=A0A388SRW5_9ACTN|nr:hypothetical protein [Streptomyces spongiicola]GBP99316.1 hypothetical protein SSP531S_07110 [Streptomyces spongiicola]